jgi:hypothetical protein
LIDSTSRDYHLELPHKQLTVAKAEQNCIQFRGDRFQFLGGGTSFGNGAKEYSQGINKLIPLTDGSIRISLDTGCGVCIFSLSKKKCSLKFCKTMIEL